MKPFTFFFWLVVIAVVSYGLYRLSDATMKRQTTPPAPTPLTQNLSARSELLRALGDLGAEGR